MSKLSLDDLLELGLATRSEHSEPEAPSPLSQPMETNDVPEILRDVDVRLQERLLAECQRQPKPDAPPVYVVPLSALQQARQGQSRVLSNPAAPQDDEAIVDESADLFYVDPEEEAAQNERYAQCRFNRAVAGYMRIYSIHQNIARASAWLDSLDLPSSELLRVKKAVKPKVAALIRECEIENAAMEEEEDEDDDEPLPHNKKTAPKKKSVPKKKEKPVAKSESAPFLRMLQDEEDRILASAASYRNNEMVKLSHPGIPNLHTYRWEPFTASSLASSSASSSASSESASVSSSLDEEYEQVSCNLSIHQTHGRTVWPLHCGAHRLVRA
jgi:hypothetical protein